MPREPTSALGFLTPLAILGEAFDRCFPVDRDDCFADLMAKLDHIETAGAEIDESFPPAHER